MKEETSYAKHLVKRLKNTQNLKNGSNPMKRPHAQGISLPDSVKYMQGQKDSSRVSLVT